MKAFAFVIFATVALGYSIVQARGNSDCVNRCKGILEPVFTMVNNGANETSVMSYINVRWYIIIVLSSTL